MHVCVCVCVCPCVCTGVNACVYVLACVTVDALANFLFDRRFNVTFTSFQQDVFLPYLLYWFRV